jgi:hypothetical protein
VKVVSPLRSPVDAVPEVDCEPDQPPLATQLVAFAEDQVSVEALPALTVDGFALMLTVGAGAGVPGSVGVTAGPPPQPAKASAAKRHPASLAPQARVLEITCGLFALRGCCYFGRSWMRNKAVCVARHPPGLLDCAGALEVACFGVLTARCRRARLPMGGRTGHSRLPGQGRWCGRAPRATELAGSAPSRDPRRCFCPVR